jgi:hypothetical protein
VSNRATAIDRLNGRLALLLTSLGILLIVLAGWFLLVAPKRSKAADLEAKAVSAQGDLFATQRFLKSSAGRKSAAQLKLLKEAVPRDAQMSQVIRQLTRSARVAGVRVTGITPAAMVATTGGQAIPLGVIAEGHYFRLQKFVHMLRSAATVSPSSIHVTGRLFSIDGVNFVSAGSGTVGGSSKGLITATLAVDAFISTPGAPTGQTSSSTTSP